MQHAVDIARPERSHDLRREFLRGVRAVNFDGPHRNAVRRKIRPEIAGPIASGEVEQRRSGAEPARREPCEIARAAVRRNHIGEAGGAGRFRGAAADCERRKRTQFRKLRVNCDRTRGIGARHQQSLPGWRAEVCTGSSLDPQQGRDPHLVSAGAKRRGGALRISCRPGDEQAHLNW